MKSILRLIITSALFLVAGCGSHSDSDTGGGHSNGGHSNLNRVDKVINLDSSAIIYVEYEEMAKVGEPWEILIKMRANGAVPGETVGTIHWGDYTDDRVRDGMTLTHSYQSSGNYTFAIQIDGDEKKVAGTVTVLGSQTSEAEVFVSAQRETSGIFAASTCSPENAIVSRSDLPLRLGIRSSANPVPPGYGAGKDGILIAPSSCSGSNTPFAVTWAVAVFGQLNPIIDVTASNCPAGGTIIGRQEVTDAGFEGVAECQWIISPP